MSSAQVAIAKAALADAEKAQTQARRAEWVEELRQVRETLRVDRQRLEKLTQEIRTTQTALDNLRTALITNQDAIGDSARRRPAVYGLISDDPDCVTWEENHRALEAKHEQLLAQRMALPNGEVMRFDAVQLAERIKMLASTEASLLRSLQGAVPESGLFAPQ